MQMRMLISIVLLELRFIRKRTKLRLRMVLICRLKAGHPVILAISSRSCIGRQTLAYLLSYVLEPVFHRISKGYQIYS